MRGIDKAIVWNHVLEEHVFISTTLTMGTIVGQTTELIFNLKTLRITL